MVIIYLIHINLHWYSVINHSDKYISDNLKILIQYALVLWSVFGIFPHFYKITTEKNKYIKPSSNYCYILKNLWYFLPILFDFI